MEIRGRTYDGPDALPGFHEKRCSRAPGLLWEEGVLPAAALTKPEAGTARGTCTPSHHAQLMRDSSSHRIPGALYLLLGIIFPQNPKSPRKRAHGILCPQNPWGPRACCSWEPLPTESPAPCSLS